MRRDFSVNYRSRAPKIITEGVGGAHRRRQAECDEHRSERGDGIEFKQAKTGPAKVLLVFLFCCIRRENT